MKKFNKYFTLFLFCLFFLSFTYPAHTQTQSAKSGFKWPSSLTVGTNGVGSSSYASAVAWSAVIENITGMKVRVRPDNNAAAKSKWLKAGIIELNAEAISETALFGLEAREGYATRDGGPFPIRIVWLGQAMPYGFMVRGDSPIRTIYDIKPGHRIAYYTASPAAPAACDGLLAWAKVSKKDMVIVPFSSWPANIKAVAEGKADVAYSVPTAPASFEAEASPHGIRWLPMSYKADPEGAKRFATSRPDMLYGVCQEGVKSAIGVPMFVSPFYIYARADYDAEMAYQLTKWFHQNFDKYKDKHPNCKLMSIEFFREYLDVTYVPVHEGTIRYLKEIGKWTAKDDTRQKYNVDLVAKYEKAYKAAMGEADKKNIRIDPTNKEWVTLWEGFKKDLPGFKLMFEIP